MKQKGLSVVLMAGCLVVVSPASNAHQQTHSSEAVNFLLTSKEDSLLRDKNTVLSAVHYRKKLREFFTVHVNDSVQIGFDSMKVGPIGVEKSEIIQVGSYLQSTGSGAKTARGYGLELKVTLD